MGTDAEVIAFWRNAIDRVTALPGVEVAGVAESAPFDGKYPSGAIELFDRPGHEERAWHAVATTGAIRALNQSPSRTRDADLVVRGAAPGGLTTMIRRAFQEMDSTVPVRFHTLEEAHADSLSQPRFRR